MDVFISNQAYQNWLANNDKNDPDSALPELGLNSDQLFFLSFAQVRQQMVYRAYSYNVHFSPPWSVGKGSSLIS